MQVGLIGVGRRGRRWCAACSRPGTAGEKANVPLPFASMLRDNFLDAIAHRDANKDWAAIAKVAARRTGLQD